jgi:multicomponent Na+:H+ antiporter subunit D
MAAAMVLFSALCILIGVFPDTFYKLLPYSLEYKAYSASKVVFYLQLLLFSGLAFFLLLPLMRRTLTISLDTDWLWRVVLHRVVTVASSLLLTVRAILGQISNKLFATLRQRAESRFGQRLDGERAGVFARAWTIGTTALWIAVLLTAYVLFYLV